MSKDNYPPKLGDMLEWVYTVQSEFSSRYREDDTLRAAFEFWFHIYDPREDWKKFIQEVNSSNNLNIQGVIWGMLWVCNNEKFEEYIRERYTSILRKVAPGKIPDSWIP